MPSIEQLHEALRSREQAPPPLSLTLAVLRNRRRARSRFRHSFPAVAAGASIAAVAIALIVIAGELGAHRSPGSRAPASLSAAAPDELLGNSWVLVNVQPPAARPGVGVPAAISNEPVTLQFNVDGTFTASDSCNNLGGDVRVTSDTITFSGRSITDVACRSSGSSASALRVLVSKAVDRTLSGSVHWAVERGELSLSQERGTTLIYKAS